MLETSFGSIGGLFKEAGPITPSFRVRIALTERRPLAQSVPTNHIPESLTRVTPLNLGRLIQPRYCDMLSI